MSKVQQSEPVYLPKRVDFATPGPISIFRELVEGRPCQPEYGPIVHPNGARAVIEVDGRLIPIKYCPFNPRVVPPLRQFGQIAKQRRADTLATKLRQDKKILQKFVK